MARSVETAEAFDINVSFQVLFMIITEGWHDGLICGAAYYPWPIALTNRTMQAVTAKHFEFIFFGGMIIFFLIVEPRDRRICN